MSGPLHVAPIVGRIALIAAIAMAGCRCGDRPDRSGRFRRLEIEASTLRVAWVEPVIAPLNQDPRGEYYQLWENRDGSGDILHLVRDAQSRLFQLNYIAFTPEHVVVFSRKTQQLLRGAFGSVDAVTECRHSGDPGNRSMFWVRGEANDKLREVPVVLESHRAVAPDLLSAISLIRVFRDAPEYLIVSAVYSGDGRLRGASIDGGKNGDWVHRSKVVRGHDSFDGDGERQRELAHTYGLPFWLDRGRDADQIAVASSAAYRPAVLTVVNEHFHSVNFVRQRELERGRVIATRDLQYASTAEDAVLKPLCDAALAR